MVCAEGTTIWLPPVSHCKPAAFKRHSIYFAKNKNTSIEKMQVRDRRLAALL